jgi:Antibiotic biosynthesis monooxygenase
VENVVYTHATWRVRQGKEEEFVAAWNRLPDVFSCLSNRPLGGTLIQSLSDPQLFYSFGPWKNLADVEAMRSDPECKEAFRKIIELCDEAEPGAYRVVADIKL